MDRLSPTTTPTGQKVFTTGTHRVRAPQDTWDLISPRLADFGITRIADVTGLDIIGIPVAVAYRPLSRTLSVSQGKGHSLLLAKISAVMESVEMWHAEYACPAPVHAAASAADLGLTYQLKDLDHHDGSLVHQGTPVPWISATGTVTGRSTFVPRDSVLLKSSTGGRWEPRGVRVASNGLASGNTFAEAALHALYEVMERDSLSSLSAAPGDSRISVRTSSIDDPVAAPLLERITASGVFLDVALVPNRWGIPCFAAFVWSEDFAVLTAGSGAHSSTSVALSRAITEAVQSRLTLINGSRDDLTAAYSHIRRGSTARPHHNPTSAHYADAVAPHQHTFKDIDEELKWACTAVTDLTGHEPMTVDLSTCGDFSVVKVICPGLQNSTRHVIPRPDYPPAPAPE